jgi:hypothetical protein
MNKSLVPQHRYDERSLRDYAAWLAREFKTEVEIRA